MRALIDDRIVRDEGLSAAVMDARIKQERDDGYAVGFSDGYAAGHQAGYRDAVEIFLKFAVDIAKGDRS